MIFSEFLQAGLVMASLLMILMGSAWLKAILKGKMRCV